MSCRIKWLHGRRRKSRAGGNACRRCWNNNPDIDKLASGGLPAMHGDGIWTRMQRGQGVRRDVEQRVIDQVAFAAERRDAVEENLRVLVVMKLEPRLADVFRIQ